MPPLLVGPRRRTMAALVGCALAQTGLSTAVALLVGAAVRSSSAALVVALVAAVAGLAASCYGVRVLAERLGQDYVHELRGRLVAAALRGEGSRSLGITIARATNDLTAVRSWVAEGVAASVVLVPMAAGCLAVLAVLDVRLLVAAAVPLTVLAAVVGTTVPVAYARARRLRRLRGRLASQIADTLQARATVLAAGGERREHRRILQRSERVATAAVARSRAAGVLQAAATGAGAAVLASVALVGHRGGVGPGDLAAALVVVSALAAPLASGGRIAELRQNHRAACRIIAPQVLDARPHVTSRPARTRPVPRRPAAGRVVVPGLLRAVPGDRIRLRGGRAATSDLLAALAAPGSGLFVDDLPYGELPGERRRALVGLASSAAPLERGTVSRALRYRHPDADPDVVADVPRRTGLTEAVAALRRGERTELRRGGEPLCAEDVARLKLARAALGEPPLLLLDHVDGDLDPDGCRMLRDLVATFRGVVVFASEVPDRVADAWREVDVTAARQRPPARMGG